MSLRQKTQQKRQNRYFKKTEGKIFLKCRHAFPNGNAMAKKFPQGLALLPLDIIVLTDTPHGGQNTPLGAVRGPQLNDLFKPYTLTRRQENA